MFHLHGQPDTLQMSDGSTYLSSRHAAHLLCDDSLQLICRWFSRAHFALQETLTKNYAGLMLRDLEDHELIACRLVLAIPTSLTSVLKCIGGVNRSIHSRHHKTRANRVPARPPLQPRLRPGSQPPPAPPRSAPAPPGLVYPSGARFSRARLQSARSPQVPCRLVYDSLLFESNKPSCSRF